MTRLYFNGVGNISFNGTFLSFLLDDTHQNKDNSFNKSVVVELITDLNTAEGVCNFLLEEISKIKELQGNENVGSSTMDEKKITPGVKKRPPLGLKIPMAKYDHSG